MEGKTQGRRRERLGKERERESACASEGRGQTGAAPSLQREVQPQPRAGVSGSAGPTGPGAGGRRWGAASTPRLGVWGCREAWAPPQGSVAHGGVCSLGGLQGPGSRMEQRAVGSFRQASKKRAVCLMPASDPGKCGSSERWHTGVTAGAGGGGWLGRLAAEQSRSRERCEPVMGPRSGRTGASQPSFPGPNRTPGFSQDTSASRPS